MNIAADRAATVHRRQTRVMDYLPIIDLTVETGPAQERAGSAMDLAVGIAASLNGGKPQHRRGRISGQSR
jgi:hypothetical protein